MRKFLFMSMMVVTCGMMLMLTSCKSESEQRQVAEKAMECLKNKDFKGYVDLMYFSESDSADPEKLALIWGEKSPV